MPRLSSSGLLPWNGIVTLCTNKLKAKYACEQLLLVAREGSDAHNYATNLMHMNGDLSHKQAWRLEEYYRTYVLQQQTRTT